MTSECSFGLLLPLFKARPQFGTQDGAKSINGYLALSEPRCNNICHAFTKTCLHRFLSSWTNTVNDTT